MKKHTPDDQSPSLWEASYLQGLQRDDRVKGAPKLTRKERRAFVQSAEALVKNQLLNTWQPVAAIAERCGISSVTCLAILLKMYNSGYVRCARARIDGHNKVHCFKKIEYKNVMGVRMVIEDTSSDL